MRIICFGDSNTYGYDPRSYFGDRYEEPWPRILAGLTGWEVINAGLCGREIPASPAALPTDANLILVMLGTNDLLQGATAKEAARRMEHFLEQCANAVLIAPPPMTPGAWVSGDGLISESRRLAAEYRALAEKLNIPFANTSDWLIDLAFDGVHFTEASHRRFAGHLAALLQKSP